MWYIQITYEKEQDDIYHFMDRLNALQFLKMKMIQFITSEYHLTQCEFYQGKELYDLVSELNESLQEKTIDELKHYDFGEKMEFNVYPVVVEDIKK